MTKPPGTYCAKCGQFVEESYAVLSSNYSRMKTGSLEFLLEPCAVILQTRSRPCPYCGSLEFNVICERNTS